VLDLDSPDPDVGAPLDPLRLRDVHLPLWVVALVAIGCVVIAVALTRAWDENRSRREQQAVVNLIVSVPQDVRMSGGGNEPIAGYNGRLQVVNAGPLPVTVEAVSSFSDGIRVNRNGGAGGAVTVPSGAVRQVDIGVGLVCREWDREQPIELAVDVTTADGNHHRQASSVNIQGTPWLEALVSACPPDL